MVVLAAMYIATARLGLFLDSVSGFATVVWAPTGIALAALLVYGYPLWPGVALGAFFANVWVGAPVPVAMGIALGNTLEALLAAYALREVAGFHNALDRLRDVVALGVLAAGASTMVSATIGVGSLVLWEHVAPGQVWRTWLAWWWGDLAGDLLVAPLLLTWSTKRTVSIVDGSRWFERVALDVSVALVGALIFSGWGPPMPYLLFPFLIWAGVRFGPRGAANTNFLVGAMAVSATALGLGPLVRPASHDGLLLLESFMATSAFATLSLGAIAVERAKEAAAVRETERHKSAILEGALDAIVTMDHQGNILEFNAAAEDLFGFRRDDVIGKEMAALIIPPSLREAHRRGLVRYRETGEEWLLGRRAKFPAQRADGTKFSAEIAVTRVRHDGPPIFTGFIRDITIQEETARKLYESHLDLEQRIQERTLNLLQANRDLTRRDEQLQEAQALAHFGSFEWDIDEDRLTWSDELYRIYGLVPGSAMKYERLFEHIHPNDRARIRSIVDKALVDHETVSFEERVVRPDGTVRLLHSQIKVELAISGKVRRVLGTCHDITEQRNAERARSRLAAIVESSDDAIIGKSLDGIVESWNRGAERIYGYSAEEAIGQPISALVIPSQCHDELQPLIARVCSGLRAAAVETTHMRKDGTTFDAAVTMSPILSTSGRTIGISTITRDVTAYKKADSKLKESLKEKEVLLREIHHRVKNNLQVIASLLNLQASVVGSDEARLGFEESQSRVQSMALIHQLLYQAKDLASIDFAEYLQDLLGRLAVSYGITPERVALGVHAPNIRLDIDTSVPCGLIVNELVSNSLKHAFPAGRTGHIEVSLCDERDGALTLLVKDDGVGLAEAVQWDRLRTLGLQIVHTLTKQLHGTVEASADGGTTFRVTFPAPHSVSVITH